MLLCASECTEGAQQATMKLDALSMQEFTKQADRSFLAPRDSQRKSIVSKMHHPACNALGPPASSPCNAAMQDGFAEEHTIYGGYNQSPVNSNGESGPGILRLLDNFTLYVQTDDEGSEELVDLQDFTAGQICFNACTLTVNHCSMRCCLMAREFWTCTHLWQT